HQGVGHHSVERSILEVQASRVACPKLEAFSYAFLVSKTRRSRRQVRTQINTGHFAQEPTARGDRPSGDARAAPQVKDRFRGVDSHDVEILLKHLGEHRVLATRFESCHYHLKQSVIKLVSYRIGINRRHVRPPEPPRIIVNRDARPPSRGSRIHRSPAFRSVL